jgi:hypothetical protein
MTRNTRNLLRILSIVLALALVLMTLDIIPDLVNYKFWFMVVSYGLLLITLKR